MKGNLEETVFEILSFLFYAFLQFLSWISSVPKIFMYFDSLSDVHKTETVLPEHLSVLWVLGQLFEKMHKNVKNAEKMKNKMTTTVSTTSSLLQKLFSEDPWYPNLSDKHKSGIHTVTQTYISDNQLKFCYKL